MTSFRVRLGILLGIALAFIVYISCFSAPFSFPNKLLLQVGSGETGKDIAHDLAARHAIRSGTLLELLMRLYGTDTHIIAGTYYFPSAQNIFTISWRLHIGDFGLEPVRVVLPEGTDSKQMASLLLQSVPGFNSAAFLSQATEKEGYLFPDTYFVYPGESTGEIVEAMEDNFTAHIASTTLQMDIALSGHTLPLIITMASLLEKEAPGIEDRRIISGILWKRISIGMPLQVDAVFPYITGKNGDEITTKDYSIDSPYNTYTHKGLPPGPITNPGLDSILAAATPTTSNYVYYLSDKKGNFHYSSTYAGQLANEAKYLK